MSYPAWTNRFEKKALPAGTCVCVICMCVVTDVEQRLLTCQRYLVVIFKDARLFQYVFLASLIFSIKSTTNCIIGDSSWSLWWIGNRLNTGFPFSLVANSDVSSFNDPYLSSLQSLRSLLKHLSSALFVCVVKEMLMAVDKKQWGIQPMTSIPNKVLLPWNIL